MSTYKEESTLENLEESMPSKHSMKNFSSHKKTIVKEKISSDPYQESIELSEFILTYLNKTYKNVITSNCSQE